MVSSRSAITTGDGRFFIGDTKVAPPAADEVLVKIKAAGICHTDYDSLNWGNRMILGHEGAGIVEETGAAVKHVRPGDHVILNWAIPCHNCFQCKLGNEHICENNSPVTAGNSNYSDGHATPESSRFEELPIFRSFNLGTLSEYALVKAGAVTSIPKEVPFAVAAITGCGVMTGYGSVMNAAKVKAGSSVVVIGAGGVGLNVIQAAKISGAAKIIAIETNAQRLEYAKTFGATHLLQSEKSDKLLNEISKEVKKLTEGRGADYAFECTAIPQLGASPLAMIRNGGMALQLSGIEQEITIDMNLFEWDKTYINPLYGQCKPAVDFPKILDHYLKKEMLLDELVTQTYPLDQLRDAFSDMLSGKNAKGVILF